MIKKIIAYLIFILFIGIPCNSYASDVVKWSELDRQDLKYVKDVYSGNYAQVKDYFSSITSKRFLLFIRFFKFAEYLN